MASELANPENKGSDRFLPVDFSVGSGEDLSVLS